VRARRILDPNSERRILQAGERILCRHPFNGAKRCYVTPARVVALLQEVWDGSKAGTGVVRPTPEDPDDVDGVGALFAVRKRAMAQVTDLRDDHLREVNPTPYKVSVSTALYEYMHELWQREAPIAEIS